MFPIILSDRMTEIKPIDKQILPDPLLREIIKSGLCVLGGRGCGKSNLVKVLISEIVKKYGLIQPKIFDPCSNWKWEFEDIFYQTIDEHTRYIYGGKKPILFDLDLLTQIETMEFVGKVALNDYMEQRKKKEILGGHNDKNVLFVIEEAQNILGSYSLMRRKGRMWLKLISEGRNFGLSFILIGQRASNISTSALERMQGLFLGKMIADNDLAKIRRICGRDTGIADQVKKLQDVGDFVYWNGSSAYRYAPPLYKANTKPQLWTISEEEKKRWEFLYGRRII